jgi:hypothetical protein
LSGSNLLQLCTERTWLERSQSITQQGQSWAEGLCVWYQEEEIMKEIPWAFIFQRWPRLELEKIAEEGKWCLKLKKKKKKTENVR